MWPLGGSKEQDRPRPKDPPKYVGRVLRFRPASKQRTAGLQSPTGVKGWHTPQRIWSLSEEKAVCPTVCPPRVSTGVNSFPIW
jgi:hypothetical protein